MITLKALCIQQGDFSLSGINMMIPAGQYGILMGPTGCGKTTLLESICGLRKISGGKILLNDVDVSRLAPSMRQIGYVPQDAVLFPTMPVKDQIEFGLAVRNADIQTRSHRVEELSELLEITDLLTRFPDELSGGEKQRVSLGRALAFKPRLLCLDEPLASLDSETRARMIELLRNVHQQEQVAILHITHDLNEAEKLGTVGFRFENGSLVED